MTKTDICNAALIVLGMNEIVSLEENTTSAIRCRRIFPICRDRMLREHNWSFAIATTDLQQLVETSPVDQYPIVSCLPGDCTRVIRLHSQRPYLLRGDRILLQELPEKCDYIRKVDNSELFDPAFTDALISLIASELALHSTRDYNAVNYHTEQYRVKINAAKALDAIENIHQHQTGGPVNSKFLNARLGDA